MGEELQLKIEENAKLHAKLDDIRAQLAKVKNGLMMDGQYSCCISPSCDFCAMAMNGRQFSCSGGASITTQLRAPSSTRKYRRKLALMAEERAMIRDQLKAIEEGRNHESRIEKRRSEQAVRIRQLEKALKVAIGFLVDHKDQHPEVAGMAVAAIRLANGRFLDPAFYEAINDVSSDIPD